MNTTIGNLARVCGLRIHTEKEGEIFYRGVSELLREYEWMDPDFHNLCFVEIWERLPSWDGTDFESWVWCVCIGVRAEWVLSVL